MSTKNITEHTTNLGTILFMAAAKPILNKKNNKKEYSVKVELNSNDPAVAHLREIADYKVDTKTNRASTDKSKLIVNFTSDFNPTVTSPSGETLEGDSVPFFDGRTDKGTATVQYKVIDYGTNKIVRLSGITLNTLSLAPREPWEPKSRTNDLKNAIKSK